MRPWASYCPSHLKMSDEPHHLYGPFWSKQSVNLAFEHDRTLGNPGKVDRKGFVACGCYCVASFTSPGGLHAWTTQQTQCLIPLFPPSQWCRWPNPSIPWPCPRKPLAQKGHFISREPVIQSYITGPRAEHCLANWKVRQWRPQLLQTLSSDLAFQGFVTLVTSWRRVQTPQLTSGLIQMNLGFLAEKKD